LSRTAIAALLTAAALLAGCSPPPAGISGGRFGPARLFPPEGRPRGLAFLFTAEEPGSEAAARRLAALGIAVVEIDPGRYRRGLAGAQGPCLYLVGDAERLSREVERREGFAAYRAPVLAGIGEAGALVEAMAAQAPAGAVSAAVAVDPTGEVEMGGPICTAPPRDVGVPGRPVPLTLAFSGAPFASGGSVEAKPQPAGRPVRIEPLPAAPTRTESLAMLVAAAVARAPADTGDAELGDLPLTALAPRPGDGRLAVIISGDGGWRDIDKVLAGKLNERGLGVVGWDSLAYFWHEKTPEAFGRDLAKVLEVYGRRWRAERVVLIGYSFGADVLPFGYNRLPPDLRERVAQISLLGYAGRADFHIRVSGWLGAGPGDTALPDAPEMSRIDLRRVQCFYGADESDSACPALAAAGAEVIKTAGGHHFGGDYAALAQRIIDGLADRR